MRTIITSIAVALAAAAPAAAAPIPQGHEHVALDPADFSTKIDNPYWPMRPGTRWIARESEPGGPFHRIAVTVTRRTKTLANGVTARAVHDQDTVHGRTVEDTYDWYAQDRAGNLWYLSEQTTEYEHGRPASTAGSFEAGVDGAEGGVIVPAHPRRGMRYRQEEYRGHAEDRAAIVSLREQVTVPAGHYRRVLMTRETNPLEARNVEFKFLARGVGPVLAVATSGGADREELVRMRR
jgi:hypothetical protein